MKDINAQINQGMRAAFDTLNAHSREVSRLYKVAAQSPDEDEAAEAVGKIAAHGVALALAWGEMIKLGVLAKTLGISAHDVIDAASVEVDTTN